MATSPRVPGPLPGLAGPLPALPGIPGPGCPCSEGTPGGKRHSQRLHPFIPPPFHLSFSPSLHPSMSSSFHPFTLPSFCPSLPRGVSIISQGQKSDFLLKIKRKNSAKWSKFPKSPPTSSPRAPRGHSNALPRTQHSQAETISSSLVKNGRVYLSQPLILLTLLLFGPNPISSVHYKDSETTHFCSPGGGWLGGARRRCLGCRWSRRSGMRSAGSSSLQRKSLKGNFARDKKTPTFNFLTTAFLPELFILATARSINEIFNQLTSVPAHIILSGVHFSF